MKKIGKISAFLFLLVCQFPYSKDFVVSATNEIFDNPFIATGFNSRTNIFTGYISALRTSPERTDVCKFIFSGKIENQTTALLSVKDAGDLPQYDKKEARAIFNIAQRELVFNKESLPGDCEWIMSFIGEPKILEREKELLVPIGDNKFGDWLSVSVIRSKRAYFYKVPGEISKLFLVAGDLIYVYGENNDWYYAKFVGRKKYRRMDKKI